MSVEIGSEGNLERYLVVGRQAAGGRGAAINVTLQRQVADHPNLTLIFHSS